MTAIKKLQAKIQELETKVEALKKRLSAERVTKKAYRQVAIHLHAKHECRSTIGEHCCELKVDTVANRLMEERKK
jgi:DNA-binding protein YbaB